MASKKLIRLPADKDAAVSVDKLSLAVKGIRWLNAPGGVVYLVAY